MLVYICVKFARHAPKALTEFGWSREDGQLTAVYMGDTMQRT